MTRADGGTERSRPFLKWVGGKRQLLDALRRRLPATFTRYYEPFIGGGALFFDLQPKDAVLGDTNERLVRTYRGVQRDVEGVIRLLESYPHERTFFEQMRKTHIDAGSDTEVAAWFIYLNRVGYNGLYRVNSKNQYNVPFGRYTKPNICNKTLLRAAANTLASAKIVHKDFEEIVKGAPKGAFVYFDPPYVPLSATSSFASYTMTGFDRDEQERLRDVAGRLKRRGVHVLLSNSAAELVRTLYQDKFRIEEVDATRMINSRGDGRSAIKELLIW